VESALTWISQNKESSSPLPPDIGGASFDVSISTTCGRASPHARGARPATALTAAADSDREWDTLVPMGQSVLSLDDSKSARVILSRMLEKYDIEVDMAESADSIDIEARRPMPIFMDHLMPAWTVCRPLQAIKSNPQTAMIPIMM